jgi:dipeptidyl aminopeptidase/acylaminoacyl peptidase
MYRETAMTVLDYGSWPSPISAAMAAAGGRSISQLQCHAHALYWVESRPDEGGRQSLLKLDLRSKHVAELTPAPLNVRSRVHEYGGGAYGAHAQGIIFSHDADRQLYAKRGAEAAAPLTRAAQRRYADLCADSFATPRRQRWLAIVEEHDSSGPPQNFIAAIDAATGAQTTLQHGRDFYASPRLSADGKQLAWLAWDQPNMPWDGCELHVAAVDAHGRVGTAQRVAGGANESIFQPNWAPDGSLYFVSDRSGYWNLYRWRNLDRGRDGTSHAVYPSQHDFGRAQWVFGLTTYACLNADTLACTYVDAGQWRLGVLDASARRLRELPLPFSELSYVCTDAQYVYCVAAAPRVADCIIRIDPSSEAHDVLYRSAALPVAEDFLSQPLPITFPSADSTAAHGFYYPPAHAEVRAPRGTQASAAPPLLVIGHGGPTAATSTALNLGIQYWTSRGFAVFDVNYRGSTGYGRAYRDALDGQWGVADVQDCVYGALHLVNEGRADRARLAIRGRSAGGFTVLAALTFHDVFSAGASYYGVSDLEALAHDTHKFEARYLDRLIGPYPQTQAIYRERSPVHHCERLRTPIIFFQGLEDKVVPPDQAERMAAALRANGVPVAYVAFANEQHGFRRAENITRTLEAELYFYARVWGLPLREAIEPVVIENLV